MVPIFFHRVLQKWLKSGFIPDSIMSFSSDWSGLRKNYDFSYVGSEGNYYIILLKPVNKSEKLYYSDAWQMKLLVDSKDLVPHKVMLEGENVSIVTETEKYQINPMLDNQLFNFKKPKEVEIIEMP